MIISQKKRFIFFHIPKTGGSSITWNFRHVIDSPADIKNLEVKSGWQRLLHIDGRQHSSYVNNILLCEKYKSYFKFSFIRNPWDLALSWYLSLSRDDPIGINPENFKKFVFSRIQCFNPIINPIKYLNKYRRRNSKAIDRTQLSYISDYRGNVVVDYLAKFEAFEREFRYIADTLNITDYENKKLNVSNLKKVQYRDFYDEESRDLIAKLYSADIKAFGYKF